MKTTPTAVAGRPNQPIDRAQYRARLNELLALLEANDEPAFHQKLGELTNFAEHDLCVGLARMTRELHQALRELQLDTRLSQITGHEIPDAVSRLDYVVQLTEQAAHRTLDLVEQSRGLANRIAQSAASLGDARSRLLKAGNGGAAGTLADDVVVFHAAVQRDADKLRYNLAEMAASQGYQDLTGQIIKRVITLVRRLETTLLELLDAAGYEPAGAVLAVVQKSLHAAGPAVPAAGDRAASQDDADELLSRLGL